MLGKRSPRRALRIQPHLFGPEPVPGSLSDVGVGLERMGRRDELAATPEGWLSKTMNRACQRPDRILMDLSEPAPGSLSLPYFESSYLCIGYA